MMEGSGAGSVILINGSTVFVPIAFDFLLLRKWCRVRRFRLVFFLHFVINCPVQVETNLVTFVFGSASGTLTISL
jgi:hypothetical protein